MIIGNQQEPHFYQRKKARTCNNSAMSDILDAMNH